jgi:hypothetical protein
VSRSDKSKKYDVRTLTETDFESWRSLVAEADGGSIYSTPEYLDALCGSAGGSYRIVAVLKGEEMLGGVALYERPTPAGTIVENRLLLYYNGLVVRRYATKYPSENTARRLAILAALREHLDSLGYQHILLHCRWEIDDLRPMLEAGWTARPSYSYEVDIEDIDGAWERVEQNLRRLVGRCENSGVVLSDDDDFASFFDLHHEIHERKGAPLYLEREPFERYFKRLNEQKLVKLFGARLPDGKMIAGQLVLLGAHPVSHTVCAGADGEYLNIGSTPFLRWKAFEALSALGYRANDLTDAALNPVTRFKSQLGGRLVTNMVLTSQETEQYRRYLRRRRLVGKGKAAVKRGLGMFSSSKDSE